VIEQLHSILNPGPVRDFAEVIFAKLFLIGKTERTVVGPKPPANYL